MLSNGFLRWLHWVIPSWFRWAFHSTCKRRRREVLTDVFSAGLAVLSVQRLEAAAAVRPAVLHDVALAAQDGLALEAGEVLHVPVAALRLSALVGKDDLPATGWISSFCLLATNIHLKSIFTDDLLPRSRSWE